MNPKPDLGQLADRLTAAVPRFTPAEQEIAISLLRLLAEGRSVANARLAQALGLPEEQLAAQLARWPGIFRDDRGHVIGFMGLAVGEMGDHRLHLDDRALSAWCAWDRLFLPDLLGHPAEVTSRCPVTREEISLTVGPDGVQNLQPAETVLSFLAPDTPFDADVIRTFCHFVHFFVSPEAGSRWTAAHERTFLLSVADAYRLGQLTNHATFGAALAA
jgi:alkylmercury lyase